MRTACAPNVCSWSLTDCDGKSGPLGDTGPLDVEHTDRSHDRVRARTGREQQRLTDRASERSIRVSSSSRTMQDSAGRALGVDRMHVARLSPIVVPALAADDPEWPLARVARATVLTAIGYWIGARLGMALTPDPQPVASLWPPNAILLAALLLVPTRYWWVVLLGALPAHLAVQLGSGVPMPMVLSWFVSNVFEAALGASLVRRFSGPTVRLDSVRALARVRGVCELLRRVRVVVPRRRLRGVERLGGERLLERLARPLLLERPGHADDRPGHPQLRRANVPRDEDGVRRPVCRRHRTRRGDVRRLRHRVHRDAEPVAHRARHAVPARPAPALGGGALRDVRGEPGSAGRDRGRHLGRGARPRTVRDAGCRGPLGAALPVPDRPADV